MKLNLLPLVVLLGASAMNCDKAASTDSSGAAATSAAPAPSPSPAPRPAASTATAATTAAPAAPAGSVAMIPTGKINPAAKSAADRISKAYEAGLKSGTFADSADCSDQLKTVTPAQWQQVFNGTKAKYGDEKSMAFADAWDDEKGGTIYRYKAVFSKTPAVEFRVDLNAQNISTKFGAYDWTDSTP